uniref:Uncharacterized protein n=1 Tax=Molossus molossus TaxID=27622 RepID=A0A7J8BYI3_MOLMO|nr:hypothetical protein HJG59_010064 [Molossus molossus]
MCMFMYVNLNPVITCISFTHVLFPSCEADPLEPSGGALDRATFGSSAHGCLVLSVLEGSLQPAHQSSAVLSVGCAAREGGCFLPLFRHCNYCFTIECLNNSLQILCIYGKLLSSHLLGLDTWPCPWWLV